MSLGVDVGGTFTDLAWWDGGRLRVAKTSSTPDQSDGVAAGAAAVLAGARAPFLIHGTTVATNALLERSGVRTVLVAEDGFEDIIEIGRQHRPSLYDPDADRATPLVPRRFRVGWTNGEERRVASQVAGLDPGAVAVSFRYSFADPDSERRVSETLMDALPGVPVVASHQVAPEFREFERTSTTVVNAYLQPAVSSYLRRLERRLVPAAAESLLVMRSSGGLMDPEAAAGLSAAILLSGPAGGVVAAAALGQAMGRERVISFDMGGTSTDVCRIEGGRPEVTYERSIDGLAVRMPSVAVYTVGAGGGSIGWRDPGGALRVGPRSAGAFPGPACYGRGGTEPAVTDANVALGRIDPAGTLAGAVALDAAASHRALDRLGEQLGLDTEHTAAGMLEVVEATMERAVRVVSVEQGADPRQAVLVAFGGAGGLHATALARRLEMAGVVVPPFAGVFSALGLLLSPPRHDSAMSVLLDVAVSHRLDPAVQQVAASAEASLEASSELETLVDVRYVGQAHETSVPYRLGEGWEVLTERFHRAHAERNGFSRPGDPIEVVTVRAAAIGRPALSWDDLPEHRPLGPARRGARPVTTSGQTVEAEVWWRPGMDVGQEVVGPAVVEEGEATTWVAPGEAGRLHPSGALEITW